MAQTAEADFSTILARFTKTARQLNDASTTLNSILQKVEKSVVDANAGVEVWLEQPSLASSDATGSAYGHSSWTEDLLGFAKVDGAWCLAIKTVMHETGYYEGDMDSPYHNQHVTGEAMPLAQASRDLRIEAVRLIPALLDRMTEAAQSRIRTIEDAKRLTP